MGLFTGSPRTETTSKDGQTTSKDYDGNGALTAVRHTNDATGKTHSHEPGHHPLGSDTGRRIR